MSDWHAPEPLLSRFARDPGGLDHAAAASVESHLVGCERCRSHLRAFVEPAALEQSWDAIADRVDRPRSRPLERLLRRARVRDDTARLVGATSTLSGAWLAALLAVTAGVAVISRLAGVDGPFLVLAPLGPLAAVVVTFAAVSDPAGEAGVATAMNGLTLMLRRTTVVLIPSFVAIGLAGLVVPGLGSAVLWILPALALSSGALALGTWCRVEVAAIGLAVSWITTLASVKWLRGPTIAFRDLPVFSSNGQVVFAALCLGAAWTIVRRRTSYETLEIQR